MSELARAMELVGNKWALHIVESLLGGPRRFTEIERSLGDVNPKLITVRLRELEAAGLVSRTAYAEVPPRVEYAITTLFGSLSTIPFVELFGQREGVQWLGGVMLLASFGLGIANMLSDIRGGHGTTLPSRVRATFTTITILGLLLFLGTAISGALPLYRVALILMLAMPAGTFVYVVARLER